MTALTAHRGAVASCWSLAAVWGARGIGFLGGILLARFLSPEAFGVVGLALVVTSTVGIFQDLGLGKAILVTGGEEEPGASTAFLSIVGIAGLFTAALLVAAPGVSALLGGGPDLARVLRLLSPLPLLGALAVVPAMLLERRLDYRRRALTEWTPALAFPAVAVLSALAMGGPEALALGHLAALAVAASLAFALSGFRPRFRFDRDAARDLFRFGRWVTLASLAAFAFLNADRVLVGHRLGAETLGLYLLAMNLACAPAVLLSGAVGRVALSAFSGMRREGRDIAEAYVGSLSLLTWLALPLAVLLGWIVPGLLPAVFGKAWAPAAPLLRILAVYGLFRCVSGLSGSVFLAHRRSDLFFLVNLVQLLPPLALLWIRPGSAATVAVLFTAGMALGGALAIGLSFRLSDIPQARGWNAFLAPLRSAALAGLLVLAVLGAGLQPDHLSTAVPVAALALLVHGAMFVRSPFPKFLRRLRTERNMLRAVS